MAINLSVTLILLASWLNASQTYILSYRAQIKNAVVISESFQASPTMSEIKATPAQKITIFSPKETDIQNILKNNKDEILEFLMKYGAHTRSFEKVSNLQSSSLLILTLPPTYVTVDFNDNYAIITRLIQE